MPSPVAAHPLREDPDKKAVASSGGSSWAQDPWIRRRLLEFLGGTKLGDVSALYLQSGVEGTEGGLKVAPARRLREFLNSGGEIQRSLWDRRSLVVDLDIEHINFDVPAEALQAPRRTWMLLEPVLEVARRLFSDHGIPFLELVSGRGPHFLFLVSRDSSAFRQLAALGQVSPGLAERSSRPQPPENRPVEAELTAAFAGLGKLMEFVAQVIKVDASPRSSLPLEVTEVLAGPGLQGREIVSIDISEYGDPLATRAVRAPFSPYLKPYLAPGRYGEAVLASLPDLHVIPRHDLGTEEAIEVMRSPELTARLARRASAVIPDASEGVGSLISAYLASDLAAF
ncbi:MAG: hypothetical protein KDD47_13325, partial [Acidobacteria bacterium]|nr:hypothetical protein [Acidobacteriota bacterium]